MDKYRDWPIPEGISPRGLQAAQLLQKFFKENNIEYHGGGGKFYTPEEWAERGEQYGLKSVLVITHDGGEHAVAFDWDRAAMERYATMEKLKEELEEIGLYVEACTCWYSAIYEC